VEDLKSSGEVSVVLSLTMPPEADVSSDRECCRDVVPAETPDESQVLPVGLEGIGLAVERWLN
jgi:hypothetical protein